MLGIALTEGLDKKQSPIYSDFVCHYEVDVFPRRDSYELPAAVHGGIHRLRPCV